MAKRANKMVNVYQVIFTFTWTESFIEWAKRDCTTEDVWTARRSFKTYEAAMEKAMNLVNGTDKDYGADDATIIEVEVIDKTTKETIWKSR